MKNLKYFIISLIFFHTNNFYLFAKVSASNCNNGLTQSRIDKLYEQGIPENRIEEMCQDSALNPSELDQISDSDLPDSLKRRLLSNNKASTVLNLWPIILASFASTGKLPPGITPYFPEEIE